MFHLNEINENGRIHRCGEFETRAAAIAHVRSYHPTASNIVIDSDGANADILVSVRGSMYQYAIEKVA